MFGSGFATGVRRLRHDQAELSPLERCTGCGRGEGNRGCLVEQGLFGGVRGPLPPAGGEGRGSRDRALPKNSGNLRASPGSDIERKRNKKRLKKFPHNVYLK